MYTQCVKCSKIGVTCKGPYFMDMSVDDIMLWIKARKAHLGWTAATLAERSRVPVGTVNRLLSGSASDFRFESLRPLLIALTGSGGGSELPCPDPDTSEINQLASRVRHLEQELTETRRMAEREHAQHASAEEHLTGQTKNLRKALSLMTAALIFVLFAIICVLLYDINHLDVGYFRG